MKTPFLLISTTWLTGVVFGSLRRNGNHEGPGISGKIHVYHISPDGERREEAIESEDHLKDVLCSEDILSKLHPCSAEGTEDTDSESLSDESTIAHSDISAIYPMTESYFAAARSGYACPLPAPFMEIQKSKCCVGSSEGVWPNVCPNRDWIGSNKNGSPTWELNSEFNVNDPKVLASIQLPLNVFKIGRPDVPSSSYTRWQPTYVQILVYFVLFMFMGAVMGYVYNKLAEETAVIQGQKREEMFLRSKQREMSVDSSDVEDDEAMPDDRLLPNENDHLQTNSAREQVSLAFGLLPGLPRGRASVTSPRQSARGDIPLMG